MVALLFAGIYRLAKRTRKPAELLEPMVARVKQEPGSSGDATWVSLVDVKANLLMQAEAENGGKVQLADGSVLAPNACLVRDVGDGITLKEVSADEVEDRARKAYKVLAFLAGKKKALKGIAVKAFVDQLGAQSDWDTVSCAS